ncbi:MAG: hypothetical protein DMG31_06575 [Acidobacteria bacterium]|nr:MAG: hypothetical protein DMG31_06575 [Acidobacteriota bacterium]
METDLSTQAFSSSWPCRVIRIIEQASRQLPGRTSCPVQAFAGQVLLAMKGCQTQLRIGVARLQLNCARGVESRGRIVLGNRSDLHFYRVLRPPDYRKR